MCKGCTEANPRETNCTPTFFLCKDHIKILEALDKLVTVLKYFWWVLVITCLVTIHDKVLPWTAIGWNLICSPCTTVCNHAVLNPTVWMLSISTGRRGELWRGSGQMGKWSTFSTPEGSTSLTRPCRTICFLMKDDGKDWGVVNFLNCCGEKQSW